MIKYLYLRHIETQDTPDPRFVRANITSLKLLCTTPITKIDIMRKSIVWMTTLPIAVQCGDVLWSGVFNSSASVVDFDKCAFVLPEHTSIDCC